MRRTIVGRVVVRPVVFVLVSLAAFGAASTSAGAQDGGGVVPVTPCVVLDTTQGVGGFAGPLAGGQEVDAQVSGAISAVQGGAADCAIPIGASGVVVDITAVSPVRAGNLRAFPTGEPSTGGVVNFSPQSPSLDNSNAVVLPLSASGKLTVSVNAGGSTAATVHVRVTVIGFVDEAGLRYTPVTPCAVFDSRPSQGANSVWDGPFVGSEARTIGVAGLFDIGQGGGSNSCGIPNSADAVFVNLVALNATGQGRFGVRPAGDSATTTYVSYAGLTPVMNNANAVIVPLSATGDLEVFSVAGGGSQANGRVVVLGYLDTEGDPYVPLSPCAVFDSRQNQGAADELIGPFDGGEIVEFQIAGALPSGQGGGNTDCGVPVGASAVLMNLVAINPLREGNLRVNAVGTTPTGGVVNFADLDPSMNNSNAVAVPLSLDGRIEVGVNAGSFGVGQPASDVRGVVLGYFLGGGGELSVDVTSPVEGAVASRPTTISGVATDDVGVAAVDLVITDAVTGRFLAECGPGDFCWLSLVSPISIPATLSDPGSPVSGFTFGPVDLDAGGSGSYRVEATVSDGEDNEADDIVWFRTTPATPPSVELVAPANGAIVADQAALWVSASDDQGILTVSAVLQDVNTGNYLQQFGSGEQTWQAGSSSPIPLAQIPGTETWAALIRAPGSAGRTVRVVAVTAGDGGGSSRSVDPEVVFTIGPDVVDPEVSVSVPSMNQIVPRPMTLLGTTSDGSGVAQVEVLLQDANLGVYWNGSTFVSSPVWINAELEAFVTSDSTWTLELPLALHDPLGSVNFLVTARATDVVGNQTTTTPVSFSSAVDTEPPTISLTNPSDGLLPPGPATIDGAASDNTGVVAVSVSIFDPGTGDYWGAPGWVDVDVPLEATLTAPFGAATGWSLDLFDPNDGSGSGSYEFTVRAVDLAGLVTSQTFVLNIDEAGPTVAVTSPENGDVVAAGLVKILGEALDPAGIDAVEIEIRDVSGGPTRWWDGAGWVNVMTRVVAPITDSYAGGADFGYISPLPGTSGEHNVRAYAVDGLGNAASSISVDFVVDSGPPTVALVGATTGLSSPFDINVNADDDVMLETVELRVQDASSGAFFNGTDFVPAAVWLDVPNLSSLSIDPDGAGGSGSYTVTARATDGLGQSALTPPTSYGTTDGIPPVALITAPADGSIVADPDAIVGTATDSRVVSSVEVEVREWICGVRFYTGAAFQSGPTDFDAVISSGSGTGDVSWTAPIDLGGAGGCGSYRARVRAFDLAGNGVWSTAIYFDVDSETPTATITQPSAPAVTAPFNLFISASDDSPGLEVFYTIQDAATGDYWDGNGFDPDEVVLAFGGLTEIFPEGDKGSGQYKITASAVDVVGNRSPDDVVVVEVLASSRDVELTSPLTSSTSPISLSGTAHSIDGVDTVETRIVEQTNGSGPARYWDGAGWVLSDTWVSVTQSDLSDFRSTWSTSFVPRVGASGVYLVSLRLTEDDGGVVLRFPDDVMYDPPRDVQILAPVDEQVFVAPPTNIDFSGTADSDVAITSVELRLFDTVTGEWVTLAGGRSDAEVSVSTVLAPAGAGQWTWNRTVNVGFGKFNVQARSFTLPGGWSGWGPITFVTMTD